MADLGQAFEDLDGDFVDARLPARRKSCQHEIDQQDDPAAPAQHAEQPGDAENHHGQEDRHRVACPAGDRGCERKRAEKRRHDADEIAGQVSHDHREGEVDADAQALAQEHSHYHVTGGAWARNEFVAAPSAMAAHTVR